MKKSKIYEVNDNLKITEFNLLQVVTWSASDWVIKWRTLRKRLCPQRPCVVPKTATKLHDVISE